MEPENTPLEEEKHLPRPIIFKFYVNLRGCTSFGVSYPTPSRLETLPLVRATLSLALSSPYCLSEGSDDFSKIEMWMRTDGDIQCIYVKIYMCIYIYIIMYCVKYMLIHSAVSEISWRDTSMWYIFNFFWKLLAALVCFGVKIKNVNENTT